MALPGDVTTCTITFGPYLDAEGNPAITDAEATLRPVDPATGSPIRVVHVATGITVVPTSVPISILGDGTASVGPVPHTDNAGLSPVGFAYRVEWKIASGKPSPGDKTIAVPTASGSTVDYDVLVAASGSPGVLIPIVVASVNGKVGQVVLNAADVGAATPAELSAGLATKVNSSTYTTGLAAKQDVATLGAAVAADATVRAALVPFWTPSEAVTAGVVRMTALGVTITRNSNGTTRASYDGTEAALWTVNSDEQVRDLIGSTLIAGLGLTKTVDDAGDTVTLQSSGITTKRVRMPLASDGGSTTASGFGSVCTRAIILIPVTTTRWRLLVRNANPRTAEIVTGVITMTDGYVGLPSFATDGAWAGGFTAVPTKAFSGGDTPADGSEWVSNWVTDPTLQFTADTAHALSWGFSCSTAQNIVKGQATIGRVFFTAGADTQVGQQAAPTGSSNLVTQFLDVRLEFETVTNLPVVLVVSDSTGIGVIDDTLLQPAQPGQHIAWPGQMALMHRALVMNASLGAAAYSNFASASSWALQRFDLATTVPDLAILGCGLNDIATSLTVSQILASQYTVRATLRTLGIKRFATNTMINQPQWNPGVLAGAVIVGATTLTTSLAYATGVALTIDGSTSASETLTTTGASTGTGPYTTTVTTAATKAHRIGAPVATGREITRVDYNAAVRSGKAGPGPVFDFAEVLRAEDMSQWFGTGTIHPSAGAQYVLARATVIRV